MEALSDCFKIFEIFGQQYFSLKALLTTGNAESRVSVFHKMAMLIVLSTLTYFFVGFAKNFQVYIKRITSKNVLLFSIFILTDFGYILASVISTIQSYFKTKVAKKIFLNTREIARIARREFNIEVDFIKIRKAALKKTAVIMILFVFCNVFLMLSGKDVVEIIHYYTLQNLFLTLTAMKFSFQVDITVNCQLELLETLLANLFSKCPIQTYQILLIKQTASSNIAFRKIFAARSIYNLIYENGALINSYNGLPILAVLATVVSLLTFNGYEIFILMIGELPMSRVVITIYDIFLGLAFLLEIINCCQDTGYKVTESLKP